MSKISEIQSEYSNLTNGCIGFDCGDGWSDIVENLMYKLSKIDGVKVAQLKEKFGILRIYVDIDPGSDDYDEIWNKAYKFIEDAEKESGITCECCGSKETITTEGSWLKTLCSSCRDNRFG